MVNGRARAEQTDRHDRDAQARLRAPRCPSTIHGDAAFPGQGVVAETLNLSNLAGYSTGGTLHLIANNQVGFTTDPREGAVDALFVRPRQGLRHPDHPRQRRRSLRRASRRCASRWRTARRFHGDVLIDLVGYRRHGHNEGDEASFTQPMMAAKIKAHPTLRQQYATQPGAGRCDCRRRGRRDGGTDVPADCSTIQTAIPRVARQGRSAPGGAGRGHRHTRISTPVCAADALTRTQRTAARVAGGLHRPSEGEHAAAASARRHSTAPGGIDWGHAEALALASLLMEDTPVRLTGQDVGRGTFSHRHMVLHDVKNGTHVRADAGASGLQRRGSKCTIRRCPNWHASGSNTATRCRGDRYAGALGSAVRRFRQRRAGDARPVHRGGIQQVGRHVAAHAVAAARLRRERSGAFQRPRRALPAGRGRRKYPHRQLHHAGAVFPPAAAPGQVVGAASAGGHDAEVAAAQEGSGVVAGRSRQWRIPHRARRLERSTSGARRRARWCSAAARSTTTCSPRRRSGATNIRRSRAWSSSIRSPTRNSRELLSRYPSLTEVVWTQEEPRNMGPWTFMEQRLSPILPPGVYLRYVGRPERAAPSEGYASAHAAEQARIVAEALSPGARRSSECKRVNRDGARSNRLGERGIAT